MYYAIINLFALIALLSLPPNQNTNTKMYIGVILLIGLYKSFIRPILNDIDKRYYERIEAIKWKYENDRSRNSNTNSK